MDEEQTNTEGSGATPINNSAPENIEAAFRLIEERGDIVINAPENAIPQFYIERTAIEEQDVRTMDALRDRVEVHRREYTVGGIDVAVPDDGMRDMRHRIYFTEIELSEYTGRNPREMTNFSYLGHDWDIQGFEDENEVFICERTERVPMDRSRFYIYNHTFTQRYYYQDQYEDLGFSSDHEDYLEIFGDSPDTRRIETGPGGIRGNHYLFFIEGNYYKIQQSHFSGGNTFYLMRRVSEAENRPGTEVINYPYEPPLTGNNAVTVTIGQNRDNVGHTVADWADAFEEDEGFGPIPTQGDDPNDPAADVTAFTWGDGTTVRVAIRPGIISIARNTIRSYVKSLEGDNYHRLFSDLHNDRHELAYKISRAYVNSNIIDNENRAELEKVILEEIEVVHF
jgi:hypothetical protein